MLLKGHVVNLSKVLHLLPLLRGHLTDGEHGRKDGGVAVTPHLLLHGSVRLLVSVALWVARLAHHVLSNGRNARWGERSPQ